MKPPTPLHLYDSHSLQEKFLAIPENMDIPKINSIVWHTPGGPQSRVITSENERFLVLSSQVFSSALVKALTRHSHLLSSSKRIHMWSFFVHVL
jgi:hypothetical protein